ncbi:MAG: PHB depolymerase family esterase [Pseudomonadota bacterium]
MHISSLIRRAAAALGLALALASGPAAACGGTAEEAECPVDGGFYRLALPEGAEEPVPAVLFLHGWGSSSASDMRNRASLRETLNAGGYALILPEGRPRAGRTQKDWAVRDGGRHVRDDIAFFEAILADAARRGVDPERVMLAGFSRGGSMVWDVACARPDLFRAFAPVAGAYWVPMPEACAPVPTGGLALHHTHGWTDRVVPLEGRLIGGGRKVQGDVFESLAMLRGRLGCTLRLADATRVEGDEWQRDWTSCEAGRISLRLHPGGHIVPEGWAVAALAWFEDVLAMKATPPTR